MSAARDAPKSERNVLPDPKSRIGKLLENIQAGNRSVDRPHVVEKNARGEFATPPPIARVRRPWLKAFVFKAVGLLFAFFICLASAAIPIALKVYNKIQRVHEREAAQQQRPNSSRVNTELPPMRVAPAGVPEAAKPSTRQSPSSEQKRQSPGQKRQTSKLQKSAPRSEGK